MCAYVPKIKNLLGSLTLFMLLFINTTSTVYFILLVVAIIKNI